MPRHRTIQIRFIRRGPADPSRDDILIVTKLGDNSLRVVYTEKNHYDSFTDLLTITYAQLVSYIYRTIQLLTLDEDPFQSVQFFVPGYPTLLLGVDKLKENTGNILEMISFTMLNWPTIGREENARSSDHSIPDSLLVGGPQETADAANNGDRTEGT